MIYGEKCIITQGKLAGWETFLNAETEIHRYESWDRKKRE